jgi:hypothetical protein
VVELVYTLNLGFSDEGHASSSLACSKKVEDGGRKVSTRKGDPSSVQEKGRKENLETVGKVEAVAGRGHRRKEGGSPSHPVEPSKDLEKGSEETEGKKEKVENEGPWKTPT